MSPILFLEPHRGPQSDSPPLLIIFIELCMLFIVFIRTVTY